LYSDLKKVVPCPGICTGPSTQNDDALVCVLTYEMALLKMTRTPEFFGNDLLVIDEIHSICERTALEELLCHPNFAFTGCSVLALSGTIPNSQSLANALGKTTKSPCFVIGMKTRPIQLTYAMDLGHPWPLRPIQKNDRVAWKKMDEDRNKRLPLRLSRNRRKTGLLRLVQQLNEQKQLPAMVVAFSCRALNEMAGDARAVDFFLTSNEKWRVCVLFKTLRGYVGEEAYPLFREYEILAQKGIVLYHSKCPKHYLETVAIMCRSGLAKLIFATSALSTGINLPVAAIVITSMFIPSNEGTRKLISANLFHQICGRAGRPGLSEKGLIVLCNWTDGAFHAWKTLLGMRQSSIQGKGFVTPVNVLGALQHGSLDPKTALCTSPFAPQRRRTSTDLLLRCEAELEKAWPAPVVQQALLSFELADLVENSPSFLPSVKSWVPNETKVLLLNEFPRLRPLACTFARWVDRDKSRSFKVVGCPEIMRYEWVVDTDVPVPTMPMDAFTARNKVREVAEKMMEGPTETSVDAYDLSEAYLRLKKVCPECFTEDFHHIVRMLRRFGFLVGNVVSAKGRFATSVQGLECPVSFAEAVYAGAVPKEDPATFAATVAVFLNAKRRGGRDGGPVPAGLRAAQDACDRMGWFEPETAAYDVVRLWANGRTMCQVVFETGIAPGHACRLLQRLDQTLRSLADIRDFKDVATASGVLIRRGLPFCPSLHLR